MSARCHIRSAFFVLLALAASLKAQHGEPRDGSDTATFYSNVSEVRVTFFATDANDRPLENVSSGDFAVVDNGIVVRNFRSFSRSNETLLDLVALVDVSESVKPSFRDALNDVLQLVSQEQSVPEENIAVLSFGGLRPAILCSSGCRGAGVTNAILAMKNGGLTPLYDGLVFGADFVAQHRRASARPVLILFSDGRDTISMHSAREALEVATNSGVLIYTVDTGTAKQAPEGSALLRQISAATGGRYFSVGEGAVSVLKAVLDDLRASYVVTYEPPIQQSGYHSLRLLPTRDLNLRFHTRSGYRYQPPVH